MPLDDPQSALLPHSALNPSTVVLPHKALLPESALLPHRALVSERFPAILGLGIDCFRVQFANTIFKKTSLYKPQSNTAGRRETVSLVFRCMDGLISVQDLFAYTKKNISRNGESFRSPQFSSFLESRGHQQCCSTAWIWVERGYAPLTRLQHITGVDLGHDVAVRRRKFDRCNWHTTDQDDPADPKQSPHAVLDQTECDPRSCGNVDLFKLGIEANRGIVLSVVAAQFRLDSVNDFVLTGPEPCLFCPTLTGRTHNRKN